MEIRTRTIERLRDALLESGGRKATVTSSAYSTLARAGLLTDEEKEAVSRVEAVAETMFLVIAADEQIADTEMLALRGAIRGLTGDVLSEGVVQVMVENYALALRDEGREKRLTTIAGRLKDSGEAMNAFALAAAVALADGQVADSESELIVELKDVFGLDNTAVRTVLGQLSED